MRRTTAALVTTALTLGVMGAGEPAHSDCPMTVEGAVREHEGFTVEATILDRKAVTVTITNTGEDELVLPLQDWSLRVGYESSAVVPTSVPARRAHEIVLDPVSVGPDEVFTETITMRSHRTRMAVLDLVPADAPCGEVVWVRLTYAAEVGGETVHGAANIQVIFAAD
jgi:hypothetical protein